YRVRFARLSGQIKQYVGQVYIEPWSPGRTAVTYELVVEPDVLAPRSAINRSIRHSASGFVHALRQRIGDLHRIGYLHPARPPRAFERAPLAGAPLTPKSTRASRDGAR